MKRALAIASAAVLMVVTPAFAHRIDEYLEAATILVSAERVQVDLRLSPGIVVVPSVVDSIDTNRDGILSDDEQRTYAERVMRDLTLGVDDTRLDLRLVSWQFATIREMKDGVGEIRLAFDASLPRANVNRHLTFENRHRSSIAAYLVNGLVPIDPAIRITAQNRNYQQSSYEMTFIQESSASTSVSFGALAGWLLVFGGAVAGLLTAVGALRRRRSTLQASA